ncbi:MAG: 3-oxoacyl-[acyl-carrier-protein] reductase [Dehalococcoidia bacterium]|nr:3-oxoacyl-[acyl-carrier-protein] reductase [Dehalococcoidia bacterium]
MSAGPLAGPLSGRTALVTGAARGIGRAIALDLGRAGARVFITYRGSEAQAAAVAEELRAAGTECRVSQLDVRVAAEVDRVVAEAKEAFGGVQILVNNAGMTDDALVMRMSEQQWDDVIETNLRGTFLMSKAVLRDMLRQRWGRVINITSVVGVAGNPGQANYAAAKAGIIGFTRSLALEVASRGITANAVAPGFVLTDMTSGLTDERKGVILSRIPLGRYAEAAEIAPLVTFLAGEGAAYITGQTYHVDGGLVMA